MNGDLPREAEIRCGDLVHLADGRFGTVRGRVVGENGPVEYTLMCAGISVVKAASHVYKLLPYERAPMVGARACPADALITALPGAFP